MSNQSSLDAATQDRKARLAHLKSLKRKQPPTEDEGSAAAEAYETELKGISAQTHSIKLSGRNYDAENRDVKLGYDQNPTEGQATLEEAAEKIAAEAKLGAAAEEKDDKPLDLFKLQPKKPNWDLKRDLERKLEVLNRRTDNAIAKLVRERITSAQKEAQTKGEGDGNGDLAGIEGAGLVGAMHEREREAEAERKEEEAEDEALGV